jgi:hypothetical protein
VNGKAARKFRPTCLGAGNVWAMPAGAEATSGCLRRGGGYIWTPPQKKPPVTREAPDMLAPTLGGRLLGEIRIRRAFGTRLGFFVVQSSTCALLRWDLTPASVIVRSKPTLDAAQHLPIFNHLFHRQYRPFMSYMNYQALWSHHSPSFNLADVTISAA